MNRPAEEELEQLVIQAQAGNQQSFEQLFYKTHNLARKVAYSIVGSTLAEDAVQESYLLVFQKLRQLKDPAAFRGWLSRLVLHTCYRIAKKRPNELELPSEEVEAPDQSQSVIDSLFLKQGLSRLQPKDRDILILRELLGLSYEEVAFALSLPLGTVRSRLHSARKHLAERLT